MENTHTKEAASDIISGNLLMLIATIFFGINLPVQKMLLPQWMSEVDLAIVLIGGAAILFWATSLFMKKSRIEKSDWKILIISGFLCLF